MTTSLHTSSYLPLIREEEEGGIQGGIQAKEGVKVEGRLSRREQAQRNKKIRIRRGKLLGRQEGWILEGRVRGRRGKRGRERAMSERKE